MLRSKPQRRNAIPKGNKPSHHELALLDVDPPDPIRSEVLSSSGNVSPIWKSHRNPLGCCEMVAVLLLLACCPSQTLNLAKDALGKQLAWEALGTDAQGEA